MTDPGESLNSSRWTERQVRASGISFNVAVSGDIPGRHTVVLLHPFPMFWWTWRRQIDPLVEAGYRVLVPDMRGFGSSDLRPGEADLADLAQDVIAIVNATGTGSFSVVGEGIGGTVAWTVAHANPSNLRSLMTVCAPHPLARHLRAAPRAIAADWLDRELGVPLISRRRLSNGTLVRKALLTWVAPDSVSVMEPLVATYSKPLARPVAAAAALETMRAARHPSSSAKKMFEDPVRVPVWSVSGQLDPRIPVSAYSTDARYAGAPITHLEINDVGHFPTEENPNRLTQLLLEHLGEAVGPR